MKKQPTENISNIARYIRSRRKGLDISQEALAARLSISGYDCTESAVSHWEHGRAEPPIENPVFANALAIALEVNPSDLVRATGVFAIPPEVEESVLARLSPGTLQLLKEASPQDLKKVEAIIRTVLAENE